MEKDFTDLLNCPICFEIPGNEVFQCRKGHTICGECCMRFLDCPQCKVPFGRDRIRNRVLESILDSLKFECANKEEGCKEMMKRGDLLYHGEQCRFRLGTSNKKTISTKENKKDSANSLKICQAIGQPTCRFPLEAWNLTTLMHLQEDHGVILREGDCIDILHANFTSHLEDSMWTPILLNLEGNDTGPLFLLRCTVTTTSTGEESFLSWMFLLVNESATHVASDYSAQFEIKTESNSQVPPLHWNLPAVGLLNGDLFLEWNPFRNPVSLLRQCYTKEDAFRLTVSVLKQLTPSSERPLINTELTWAFPTPLKISPSLNSRGSRSTRFNILCYNCFCKPIIGIVYKCLQCTNYNLCSNCVENYQHSHHIVAVVQSLDQEVFLSYARQLEGLKFHQDVKQPTKKVEFAGITCDGCDSKSITKVLYKCLQCSDFDLCGDCMDGGVHANHIFAMMTTLEQNSFLRMHTQPRYPVTVQSETDALLNVFGHWTL